MKRYKLIKEYPGSRKTGTVVESVIPNDTGANITRYTDKIGGTYGWHEIENQPEFWEMVKEPQFKVGDWVKVVRSESVFVNFNEAMGYIFRIHTEEDNIKKFNQGCAICIDPDNKYFINYTKDNVVLAATEEIEKHLKDEAKKRGYTENTIINSLGGNSNKRIEYFKWLYQPEEDILRANGDAMLYRDGQWAEIVKEEEIKIGGYNTSFDYDQGMFYVGCRRFTFVSIKSLYQDMCYFGISIVRISDIDIEARTVKLILDRAEKQIK